MEENVFYIALVQIMMTNKLVVFDIPRAEINNNMQNMFHILYKKTLDVQSIEPIIDKTNTARRGYNSSFTNNTVFG
jgi:hypothetical protein